jgi:hypothetical protein
VNVPSALTATLPLVVDVGPLYRSASPSASVADTVPVTTPVAGSGWPTVAVPFFGAAFCGRMLTLTATATVPPCPSFAVTVNESVAEAPPARAL